MLRRSGISVRRGRTFAAAAATLGVALVLSSGVHAHAGGLGQAPAMTQASSQAPERADEYRVKAAILFNLAKFVDWPKDTFLSPTAPLVLCVLGTDPFGSVLDDTLNGRLIGGRPLVPMRITELTPGCHMLFITGGERKRLPVIADQLDGQSVLTIGEDETFIEQGGMISLAVDGERVRFGINSKRTERAGLKVSARLLSLAGARAGGGPK